MEVLRRSEVEDLVVYFRFSEVVSDRSVLSRTEA